MPATPTISVADNENGTGTVTVSGSDAGTTNTIYTAPARGGSWTSGGNRTGDGTIDVTPTPLRNTGGVYLWRAESDDAGVVAHSNVVMNRVSRDSQSTYTKILEQVHSDVQAASLKGFGVNDIVLQSSPHFVKKKMIVVCPFGSEQMMNGRSDGTNLRDDTRYPVMLAHVDPGNRDQDAAKRDNRLQWRQDIARLFRSQQLTGVYDNNSSAENATAHRCTIEYRDSVDANAWFDANLCVGAMVLHFTAREGRTL